MLCPHSPCFVDGEESDDVEMPTVVINGTGDDAEILGEINGEPDWNFVESIVAEAKSAAQKAALRLDA